MFLWQPTAVGTNATATATGVEAAASVGVVRAAHIPMPSGGGGGSARVAYDEPPSVDWRPVEVHARAIADGVSVQTVIGAVSAFGAQNLTDEQMTALLVALDEV